MKKKFFVFFTICLFIISVSIILIKSVYDIPDYYVYVRENSFPGGISVLKMEQNGEFSLTVINGSSAVDGKTHEENYNSCLNEQELMKVNQIFTYIKDNSSLEFDEKYVFYYDDTSDSDRRAVYGLKTILSSTVSAIENIARKDEKINDITRQEFGNQWLDTIINEYNF